MSLATQISSLASRIATEFKSVRTAIAGKADSNHTHTTLGNVKLDRVDTANEGGQIDFGRASDNALAWSVDVFGNTATPNLRFIQGGTTLAAQFDGSRNLTLYGNLTTNLTTAGYVTVTSGGLLGSVANVPAVAATGTTFPGSPVAGQLFVNTTTKCSYIYNGSAWDEISRPNDIEPFLIMGV